MAPTRSKKNALQPYRDKRSASATTEPMSGHRTPHTGKLFVIQQHQASHLHYDLRLEHGGVLLSWAVPKGPSSNPQDKRFAAHVEDHPVDYAEFEGVIPEGNYGAGHVIVWDRGLWEPLEDVGRGLEKGKLLFNLHGHKVQGKWTLVRMKGRSNKPNEWLLIKEHDSYATEITPELDETSVLSGLTVNERAHPEVWLANLRKAAQRLSRTALESTGFVSPMLATAAEPFDRKGWLFEFKYDGYRLQAHKSSAGITLYSRNGNVLNDYLPEIVATLRHIPAQQFVIDGEVVVSNDRKLPDFSLLQERFSAASQAQLARMTVLRPATLWAFDLLSCMGLDCRAAELAGRKRLLKRLVPRHGAVRYSDHVRTAGRAAFQQAARIGLEGVVGKDPKASYRTGRSQSWLKVRHQRTDDFVIVGHKRARGNAGDLGSLALAVSTNDGYVYVGNVASGLNQKLRETLLSRLSELPAGAPLSQASGISWVAPELVCEVAYKEYTRAGHLRQPSMLRLREDKSPSECTGRMQPTAAPLSPPPPPQVTVTNPHKVFFPEAELEKRHLVRYYESIAPWMLPYLKDRPIVLTRFPDGIHGKSFYQRDAPDFVPDWLTRATLYSESSGREVSYFVIDSPQGLAYLANMAAIPIHAWHARLNTLEQPDWCVLDLDPKGAPFSHVVLLARAVHALCEELALPAYPKTSGASGLHVLIPLNRQLSHEHARLMGELLARLIVQRHPDIATIARSVQARRGKVYIDYLQNGHGKLLVAPFSARAEAAASVSMPLRWREVTNKLDNTRYTIKNAVARMKRLGEDPMRELLSREADLLRAMQRLNELLA